MAASSSGPIGNGATRVPADGNGAGQGGNIKVVVRVRPFNSRELERRARCIVHMKGQQTVLKPAIPQDPKSKSNKAVADGPKTFAFDKSYWSFSRDDPDFAGQDDLFADLGRPLLDNAFQGYNNCIFAYGQTGSGKSYSMMGYGPDEGVIPKICRDMFERIAQIQKDPNLICTVEVSYLEIYNERVRDLLNPANKGNLRVREHPSTGPYVEDLAKLAVRSFPEIENLMDEGNKARTVAATNMNETSSRSHAVFTLTLTQKRHDVDTNMDTEKVAKISLVDLAGSERATSTGATGARLKEGAEINRSLSTLGRVIAALAGLSTGKKKAGSMVPYRDSVLTWLLKDSLGGNSLTAMIAAISPADINFEETLSTLRYADSAKRIRNHAVVNEDPNGRMIRELKEELAQLRAKLDSGHVDGNSSGEQYPEGTPLDQQFVSIIQPDGTSKRVSKAEIIEQLGQSEKLYEDLNQTWEQKLINTEKVHKEREAALEELGISIEKGFVGMSTPKRMPHLVNLSDDPLLDECLVYNLKPGTTTVGNVDSPMAVDISLNGTKILHEHCIFDNVDGVITLNPHRNAAIMVNGIRIEQPKRLKTGYRIILGDFHIFRFNHPEEARAERAEEGSRLKHSFAADEVWSRSPPLRPGHDRSLSGISRTGSEAERDRSFSISPIPYRGTAGESDWSFARREAISASLGLDQRVSSLNDDELDTLFEDLQRIRAARRGRSGNRLLARSPDFETESATSGPPGERLLFNGHSDNLSLDTALTVPTSPQPHEESKSLPLQDEPDVTHDDQHKQSNGKPDEAENTAAQLEILRAEREQLEEALRALKISTQEQLDEKEAEHRRQMSQMSRRINVRSDNALGLSREQYECIVDMCHHWRRRRYIALAAAVLQHASELKEAQILGGVLNKSIVFQFAIADDGHVLGSTYDLVLNDLAADEDASLNESHTPAVVVRVIDLKSTAINLWSFEKLHRRLHAMKTLQQYSDKPEYMQHFKLEDPFSEPYVAEHSRIGDADIPLAAIFECKVQDYAIDVYSPYSFTVIGILRVSLEPSSAEAPLSMLKFNVVLHDFVGFAEREGTRVHAQLYFPGLMARDEGATTTQMISSFDEDVIRFESIHSMSISTNAAPDSTLRISLFARVTTMHLDKLISWDDICDSRQVVARRDQGTRRTPSAGIEQRHDMFARLQILEINEDGTYQPVEVVQHDPLDPGIHQLHQGLQRRIVIEMTSTAGATVPWTDAVHPSLGRIQLVDKSGKVLDYNSDQLDVPLHIVGMPAIRTNRDYTTNMRLVAQWDSGAHSSPLLNRSTAENMRVKVTLAWDMVSIKLSRPLPVTMELDLQVRPRLYVRPQSLLTSIWASERIVRSSTAVFALSIKPVPSRRVQDFWETSTKKVHVRGENALGSWTPRGLSLVRGYLDMIKRRQRVAEVEAYRRHQQQHDDDDDDDFDDFLQTRHSINGCGHQDFTASQKALLEHVLRLWKAFPDPALQILRRAEDPNAAVLASRTDEGDGSYSPPRMLSATARLIAKSSTLLKSGPLLCQAPTSSSSSSSSSSSAPSSAPKGWDRRHVELRPPYLHLFAPSGDQVGAINLNRSRIDRDPPQDDDVDGMGHSRGKDRRDASVSSTSASARAVMFTVHGTNKAYLFAAKNAGDKNEWLWALDRAFADEEEDDDEETWTGTGTPSADGDEAWNDGPEGIMRRDQGFTDDEGEESDG